MPPTGVKFGGCGNSLLSAAVNIMSVTTINPVLILLDILKYL